MIHSTPKFASALSIEERWLVKKSSAGISNQSKVECNIICYSFLSSVRVFILHCPIKPSFAVCLIVTHFLSAFMGRADDIEHDVVRHINVKFAFVVLFKICKSHYLNTNFKLKLFGANVLSALLLGNSHCYSKVLSFVNTTPFGVIEVLWPDAI